jgi:hypothetical protein
MSDHDLEPLSSELASLFRAERDRPAPADVARDRIFDRVQTTLGLAPGGGPTGSGGQETDGSGSQTAGGSAPRPSGWVRHPLTTGLSGLLVGGLLGAFLHAELRPVSPPQPVAADRAHSAPEVAVAPSSTVSEASASPVKEAPASAGASTDVAHQAAPSSSSVAALPRGGSSSQNGDARGTAPKSDDGPGRDVDLAAERAQLEIARTAVARNQGGRAIEALRQHAKQFPRGRLSEEREALWIQALLATGQRAEAGARAERFRKRFPKSLMLPALAQALGSNP